jgi:hypothetical protein
MYEENLAKKNIPVLSQLVHIALKLNRYSILKFLVFQHKKNSFDDNIIIKMIFILNVRTIEKIFSLKRIAIYIFFVLHQN